MSGICGYFRYDGKDVEDQALADMLFLLERQGPDDRAYWKNGSVSLGHTLLKTTRESENEIQPSTLGGQVWLTADARIDGRAELIAKLRGKAVTVCQSVTDDHLILHAYALWGTDCLDHLIGDFAFILWDGRQKQLFCATDQIGVSPLYYAQVQGGFLVSNNLSAIRVHPDISDTLNEQVIGDYLLFRMNHSADSTSFRDIKKLPAGHSIKVNQDKVCVQQYWSVPNAEYKRRPQAQYLEKFDSLFKQSVADRMRTDAAGTHLSGGMDSTSIAAMLAELKADGEAKSIEAYTYIPAIEKLSLEQPFAQKVAQKLDVPMHVYKDDEGALSPDIDDIADLPPEPSFSRRDTTRFRIFTDSARKSRTFFAGYGGDPLLFPINNYWSDLRKSGQFGSHIVDARLHMKIHGRRPPHMFPKWMRSRKTTKRSGMRDQPLPDWLNDEFVKINNLYDRYSEHIGGAGVDQNARIDMGTHPLWRRIFEWHSSAYSSLPMKVNFPFFDIRLIEWFQTISPYPWLHNKYLLRAIMGGRLPQGILERPKTPLPGNPLIAKVEQDGAPEWNEIVPRAGAIAEFVDIEAFLDRISDTKRLTAIDTRAIVRVTTLGHWLENFGGLKQNVRGSHAKLQKYKCRK